MILGKYNIEPWKMVNEGGARFLKEKSRACYEDRTVGAIYIKFSLRKETYIITFVGLAYPFLTKFYDQIIIDDDKYQAKTFWEAMNKVDLFLNKLEKIIIFS